MKFNRRQFMKTVGIAAVAPVVPLALEESLKSSDTDEYFVDVHLNKENPSHTMSGFGDDLHFIKWSVDLIGGSSENIIHLKSQKYGGGEKIIDLIVQPSDGYGESEFVGRLDIMEDDTLFISVDSKDDSIMVDAHLTFVNMMKLTKQKQ